jgi:hypothetical protein
MRSSDMTNVAAPCLLCLPQGLEDQLQAELVHVLSCNMRLRLTCCVCLFAASAAGPGGAAACIRQVLIQMGNIYLSVPLVLFAGPGVAATG